MTSQHVCRTHDLYLLAQSDFLSVTSKSGGPANIHFLAQNVFRSIDLLMQPFKDFSSLLLNTHSRTQRALPVGAWSPLEGAKCTSGAPQPISHDTETRSKFPFAQLTFTGLQVFLSDNYEREFVYTL